MFLTRVYKEKQFLVFDYEDGRTVKYDFATKQSIGIKGKPVKDLKGQLSGFSLEDLIECCDDKNYANFLYFVVRKEDNYISNIGTILSRVPKYSMYEQYFSAGITNIASRLSFKINEVPKPLLKICRQHEIKISNELIKYYKHNPDANLIAFNLDYMSIGHQDVATMLTREFYSIDGGYVRSDERCYRSYYNYLIDEYGYTAKALCVYVDELTTYEAIDDVGFIMKELYDYAFMMNKISPKFDKYPRHFLTTHKIACRNYNRLKTVFEEQDFKKMINKSYECTIGNYCFIYPNSTEEIKEEAVKQNNCVASYIQRVIDGNCHILFMRKKNEQEESLVTIEIRNNRIVQAKRRFNDPVSAEEQSIINKWNEKFSTVEKEKVA